eukprot:CAMPEP_0168357338 /NCGR_PEP_ID=MMETSP0228-20121227/534_1 /TAXON_ID=133427 /ORGANISM="Protoceratium reticulatum, Strain CCCM 535 (=CCMP 1889)" /LENGTH=87 /DNA_ID=CAMNT_0008369851 /DNA_START=160 /DNA_END=423 /DNA_ORIENTATION=+
MLAPEPVHTPVLAPPQNSSIHSRTSGSFATERLHLRHIPLDDSVPNFFRVVHGRGSLCDTRSCGCQLVEKSLPQLRALNLLGLDLAQ